MQTSCIFHRVWRPFRAGMRGISWLNVICECVWVCKSPFTKWTTFCHRWLRGELTHGKCEEWPELNVLHAHLKRKQRKHSAVYLKLYKPHTITETRLQVNCKSLLMYINDKPRMWHQHRPFTGLFQSRTILSRCPCQGEQPQCRLLPPHLQSIQLRGRQELQISIWKAQMFVKAFLSFTFVQGHSTANLWSTSSFCSGWA